MIVFIMGRIGSVWAQDATTQERLIYSTDFTDWQSIDRTTTVDKVVRQKTQYSNETFTFTLNGVGVDPVGDNAKFSGTGYMITAKNIDELADKSRKPSAFTSPLANITRLELIQGSTGSNRGIKVSVRGDGDTDWVVIHNKATKKGNQTLQLDVNRTNCQIKFEDYDADAAENGLNQNAYILDLKIYGKVAGGGSEPQTFNTLVFSKTEDIEGLYPTKIICDENGKATLPPGNTFSRKGYSFEGWTNGTLSFNPGESYTFTNETTVIRPKWRKNTYQIYDVNQEATIKWSFENTTAPEINIFQYNKQKLLNYTQSAALYIDEKTTEKQDVALQLDVTQGKVNNIDTPYGALIYNNTQFVLPAVYGMKVVLNIPEADTSTTFGEDALQVVATNTNDAGKISQTVSNQGKRLTLLYTGEETTLNLTLTKTDANQLESIGIIKDVEVTYPILPNVITENVIEKGDTDFPEKPEQAGTATITATTPHANTGKRFRVGDEVVISAQPAYGYQVKEYRTKDGSILTDGKYMVTAGTTTIEVVYEHLPLYKVGAQVSDYKMGSVTLEPLYPQFEKDIVKQDENGRNRVVGKECWYTQGSIVTASVEPADGYVVDDWKEDGKDLHSADNMQKITIGTANKSFVITLKQGIKGTVIFDYSSAHVNGSTANYKNAGSMPIATIKDVNTFTIPTNYTIFKNIDEQGKATENNYTLRYWKDKDTGIKYELGNTYSFNKSQITLIPVYEYNHTTHENRTRNMVIRYDFGRKVHYYDDPNTQERRKVCAQAVNIGSNQKPFWTAQTAIETLVDGVYHLHWRDVAMWCDTGKKGFIRNTDQEEWASFGPGTTFWVASGTGFTISILSYGKITSTTIEGATPTLDRERTNIERKNAGLPSLEEEEAGAKSKMYVYRHTVGSADVRIPIVIGDDYSYYQWIELNTLAANMVHLNVEVDNAGHGSLTKVTADSEKGATKLENGGYAILKGDKVHVSFERKFGYELDKLVNPDKLDDDGNPEILLQVNEDGSYTNTVPFTLTQTEPTEEEKAQGKRTQYEVSFEITAHRNIQICFKERPTYYVTYKGGTEAMGAAPTASWVEAGDPFTIPTNRTLYKQGYTLDHWMDSEFMENMTDTEAQNHIYQIGQTYTAGTKDLVLYPVFVANEFNIFDVKEKTTATWHLTKQDGTPDITYTGINGILVTQVENNGKKIDLIINLKGENKDAKFDNTRGDERMQINSGSVIDFPATPNCLVKLTTTTSTSKEELGTTVIADKQLGDAGYTLGNQYVEVTCIKGATHQAIFNQQIYAVDFSITYQKQEESHQTTIQSITCGTTTIYADDIARQMETNKCVTFNVNTWNEDQQSEFLPSLSGTATQGGTVTVNKIPTLLDPEGSLSVSTTGDIVVASYPIKLNFITPTSQPVFKNVVIGGISYTGESVEVWDTPQSGAIQLVFNRTMKAASLNSGGISAISEAGQTLVFKYWDLNPGSIYTINIGASELKDIYGVAYPSALSIKLHIKEKESVFHQHTFDFIVGKDGDIDAAIQAANNNTKDSNHRYYIFVPDGEYHIGSRLENEKTDITKSKISLIGQSKDGVIIWNKQRQEGLGTGATLHLKKTALDFYAQDLTLDNRLDYMSIGGTARATAFHDQANRTIMKQVALKSWQDTYFSNNSSADYRSYFEDCDLTGVMDFICGDGNIWFEKCNLIHRDRAGNNIVAAEQGKEQDWGYVFNNCTITTEDATPQLHTDYNWTLARPWNNSPACTFLNTTMKTYPKLTGWGKMKTDKVIRFHEYRSMDATGVLMSLSTRGLAACVPAAGSDECVMSDASAARYTKRNVLGGTDGFEPDELCTQIDARSGIKLKLDVFGEVEKDVANHVVWDDNIRINDNELSWDSREEALCYFLFKLDNKGKWIYQTNITATSINLTDFGAGYYCVRAANHYGGLGSTTKAIQYVITDPYELEIKKVGNFKEGDFDYGYTTICLPFNAKVPEEVNVYAATAHNAKDETTQIDDFTMELTPVSIVNANKGYVVYGPVGIHSFHPTSSESTKPTILKGNPTKEAISSDNNNCYVLAYKSSWGIGFYKYTGSTLAAYRAWLPKTMVNDKTQHILAEGRAIRFAWTNGEDTAIYNTTLSNESRDDKYYNLSGQRVETPSKPGIYISKKRGKIMIK